MHFILASLHRWFSTRQFFAIKNQSEMRENHEKLLWNPCSFFSHTSFLEGLKIAQCYHDGQHFFSLGIVAASTGSVCTLISGSFETIVLSCNVGVLSTTVFGVLYQGITAIGCGCKCFILYCKDSSICPLGKPGIKKVNFNY